MGKTIKVDDDFYDRIRHISEERGISMGEAAKIAGQEIPPPSECEAVQFQEEVKRIGLPPQDPKWIFGFIDSLAPELLETLPMMSAYAKIITKARGVCLIAQEVEEQLAEVKPGEETLPD